MTNSLTGFSRCHRTKMVCTVGPSLNSEALLRHVLQAGVDLIRINASHGKPEDHAQRIQWVRRIAAELKAPIGILIDLPGPKFRLSTIPVESLLIHPGEEISLTPPPYQGAGTLPLKQPDILKQLRKGESIFLADGTVKLEVMKLRKKSVQCRALTGGTVRTGSGINLPDSQLTLRIPTPQDENWIRFAVDQEVEWLGLSFIRTAEDVKRVRRVLRGYKSPIKVIAKIEKRQALTHLDCILDEADAVMVARGDLGVETPLEKIPLTQKRIIKRANEMGKPVITATQMLESMVDQPTPTRAEVTDIANAVLDGTDAVMLSAETAIGHFPVEAVKVLGRVLRATEANFPYEDVQARFSKLVWNQSVDAAAFAACRVALDIQAKAIVLMPGTQAFTFQIARFRPNRPILSVCDTLYEMRQYNMAWDVHPLLNRPKPSAFAQVQGWLYRNRIAQKGDSVVMLVPSSHQTLFAIQAVQLG